MHGSESSHLKLKIFVFLTNGINNFCTGCLVQITLKASRNYLASRRSFNITWNDPKTLNTSDQIDGKHASIFISHWRPYSMMHVYATYLAKQRRMIVQKNKISLNICLFNHENMQSNVYKYNVTWLFRHLLTYWYYTGQGSGIIHIGVYIDWPISLAAYHTDLCH